MCPQDAIQAVPVAAPRSRRHPLPERFAELSPFVAQWALRTERERFLKLHAVDIEELRVFYEAMLPRLDEVLDYLDQWSADQLPEDARTLFDLAMTFSETAHPLDLKWKDVDFTDAYDWRAFQFRTVSCEP
ncbi:MAG: hypothetical protein ACOYLV_04040 [Rubrivivax sp.]